jgi:hypothetical protein
VETCSERVPLDADESSVAPRQTPLHLNLIGSSGRAA